jgi:hypothetical protein
MLLRLRKKPRSEIPGQSCRALPIAGPGQKGQRTNPLRGSALRARAEGVEGAAITN